MKLITLLTATLLLLSSCGSKDETLGEVPSGKVISLATVLESPDSYHKQTVTLEGVVAAQCGNRCDFTFNEGTKSVKIYMGDIEAPILQKGTPVKVTADVFKGDKKVILTARGFTLKAKGGK